MFTGIIETIGKVKEIKKTNTGARITIAAPPEFTAMKVGASIACSGACLTLVEKDEEHFSVDVSPETLACTSLASWDEGSAVNLERALEAGGRLDGHIVAGHVDGLAQVIAIKELDESCSLTLRAPDDLTHLIAPKGSVTLDGVSLTVNAVNGSAFEIMLIPHTLAITKWRRLKIGDRLNLEVDIVARYVAQLMEKKYDRNPAL